MARIDDLVKNFLSQSNIAIVGVSDRRDTGCNMAWTRFKAAGYRVFPVNPRISTFEGQTCYPDLASIPERIEAVFILANPRVTEEIVEQCVSLGIHHVWMHCMMGTKPGLAKGMTSVSARAVTMCREKGINLIPGSCPNQFLKPDFGHALMRRIFRMMGFLHVAG